MTMSMTGYGPTGKAQGLKGTGYQQATMQNFTPEQMNLFQQLFSHLSPDSMTSRLASGDQSQFEQMEAPALKQFGQLQGGLASRFSGMGGLSARRSSGFQNTSNQASSDFAQALQGQRMGLQRQALQDLMGMSSQLLGQRPYENLLLPKQKPYWQELLTAFAPGIGSGLGQAGGLWGLNKLGLLGGQIGSNIT